VEDRAVMKEKGYAVNISITNKKKEEVVIAKDIYIAIIDIVENVGIVVVLKQANIVESARLVLLTFSNRERMYY
jgi:predicted CoA-binding protein